MTRFSARRVQDHSIVLYHLDNVDYVLVDCLAVDVTFENRVTEGLFFRILNLFLCMVEHYSNNRAGKASLDSVGYMLDIDNTINSALCCRGSLLME